jgi:hypothetical protein
MAVRVLVCLQLKVRSQLPVLMGLHRLGRHQLVCRQVRYEGRPLFPTSGMKSLHVEDVPQFFGLLESHSRMDWTIVWDRVLRGYNVSKTLRIFLLQRKQHIFLLQRKQTQPAPCQPSGPGLDTVVVQELTDALGRQQAGAAACDTLLHCHSS